MEDNILRFEKVSFEQFVKDYQACAIYENKMNFRKIYDNIKMPVRATKGSAGYDFFIPFNMSFLPGEVVTLPTGIRCKIPDNLCLMCMPKSGLGFKYGTRLANTVGLIDSDYYHADNEGHIMAKVTVERPLTLEQGQKFMQGIFVPYFITTDDTAEGERSGGFGSTGE